MKRILLIAVAAVLASQAFAADLPVKAPPFVGYPYASNGFYFGIGALGEATSATVSGPTSSNGLFTAGAAVEGVAGYQWRGGLDFIALEGQISYTNLGASTDCSTGNGIPCSVDSKWGFEERVKFGFPLSTVTNVLPSLGALFPALPALPVSITPAANVTAHPYLMVGLHEQDVSAQFGLMLGRAWQVQPSVGLGVMTQWTQGLVADVRAECTFPNTGFNLGLNGVTGGSATLGRKCVTGLDLLY